MQNRSKFGSAAAAVWQPDAAALSRSRLKRAMTSWGCDDLPALQARALREPDWFWAAAAADLGITFTTPWTQVSDFTRGKAHPRWFTGGTLNASWHCVDRHAENPALADKDALVFQGDTGVIRRLSYRALQAEVIRIARGLRSLGVLPGDRVGVFAPVSPEAMASLLAIARLGAVGVPAFSGYGPEPLAARLNACGAKVLICADATTRRGKPVPMQTTAREAVALAPSVRHLVVIPHSGAALDLQPGREVSWAALGRDSDCPVDPVMVEANEPLLVIYTSGTTGQPKGIVHSHLGYLLKPAIDFGYAFDVQQDDRIAWIADLGWMLGPLMLYGILQFGATAVYMEGLPDYPQANRFWDLIACEKATVLGVAPTAARGLRLSTPAEGPAEDLSSLRAFISTGEAWDEPTWAWLFEVVGEKRLPILNYTGGTETGGGLLSNYTIAPIAPGRFAGPLPGQDVEVLTPEGEIAEGIGELAVRNAWPGMTHGFWRDEARYVETYWSQLPDTWLHGDLCSLAADGHWTIHGRSDDTIKVGGRRIGPSEIESALVGDPQIAEAAVIGVPDADRGQKIVAFVTLRQPQSEFDVQAAAQSVIAAVGKAMAPSAILAVAGLPKTKNGKIMRRAIRARYLGDPPGDMSALDAATPLSLIPINS